MQENHLEPHLTFRVFQGGNIFKLRYADGSLSEPITDDTGFSIVKALLAKDTNGNYKQLYCNHRFKAVSISDNNSHAPQIAQCIRCGYKP